jgi:hypothetical protein
MDPEAGRPGLPTPAGPVDEEVSTFLQMQEEAESLSHINRECPVPKPKGVLGQWLGFRNVQPSGLSEGDR